MNQQVNDKYLIVGLGNPDLEFKNTPHNVGFSAVEKIAEEQNASWKKTKAIFGSIAKFPLENKEIVLLKPGTYMNRSGLAARSAFRYWDIDINNLLVVQDDSDMHLGKIKFSSNQSSGGHKGLESIITALGSQKFARLKIGVRPPHLLQGGKKHVKAERFILKKLPADQERSVTGLAKEAIICWIAEGIERAMNKYNK